MAWGEWMNGWFRLSHGRPMTVINEQIITATKRDGQ